MDPAAVVNPIAAVIGVIGVAGIASTTVDTVLKHRRKLREPGRILAERFAEGELGESDYLRALGVVAQAKELEP